MKCYGQIPKFTNKHNFNLYNMGLRNSEIIRESFVLFYKYNYRLSALMYKLWIISCVRLALAKAIRQRRA